MENKIIIIYQSGKHGNTKGIAENIAKELGCTAIDVKTDPIVNLEQYNVVGFGSGIYAGSFGRTLKKWINNIKWTSENTCKPDAFIFSTQGSPKAAGAQSRFNAFLSKKKGIITISGWACQASAAKTPEALTNLKEWINTKIKVTPKTELA
ncbi:MAG: hypothetical protein LBS76_01965 [Mycoplasmataceae bacterium]|nr:hypothetical protein [Mycoplasmataceae bacterium]